LLVCWTERLGLAFVATEAVGVLVIGTSGSLPNRTFLGPPEKSRNATLVRAHGTRAGEAKARRLFAHPVATARPEAKTASINTRIGKMVATVNLERLKRDFGLAIG
jgi:hypothetical protein